MRKKQKSRLWHMLNFIAVVTFVGAYNLFKATPFGAPKLAYGVVADVDPNSVDGKLFKSLEKLEEKVAKVDKIDAVEKDLGITQKDLAEVQKLIGEVQKNMVEFQKAQLRMKELSRMQPRQPGKVSVECARHLGAIGMLATLKVSDIGQTRREYVQSAVKDILGLEAKTALASSDIPLPVEYSGEVVELVAEYGAARRFGTVYPLGTASTKLPKLTTSPAFGLIAINAAVTEKSPQVAWVTFNPSKWGGMIRIPDEIDQDSIVGLGQFIARYAAREMAKIEDTVFFTADGTGTYDSLDGLTELVVDNSKVAQLATGQTKNSQLTMAKMREMRSLVASAALLRGAYYFHPSFEQLFSSFNTAGDKPYLANAAQGATLDGFKINWVDVLPAYSTSAAAETVFGFFGDLTYHYLGARSGMRFDTSEHAAFANDQVLVRALERFTTGLMADDAIAGAQTGAASS